MANLHIKDQISILKKNLKKVCFPVSMKSQMLPTGTPTDGRIKCIYYMLLDQMNMNERNPTSILNSS